MDLPTDHELTMAELEGERRAVLALSRAYARLAYLRELAEDTPQVSPGQLRLVI